MITEATINSYFATKKAFEEARDVYENERDKIDPLVHIMVNSYFTALEIDREVTFWEITHNFIDSIELVIEITHEDSVSRLWPFDDSDEILILPLSYLLYPDQFQTYLDEVRVMVQKEKDERNRRSVEKLLAKREEELKEAEYQVNKLTECLTINKTKDA